MGQRRRKARGAPGSVRDESETAHLGQRTFSERDWQELKVLYELTPREFDVVRQLFDTGHRPYIASRVDISVHTVDTHLRHAFAKVGVDDRGDLILAFVNQVQLKWGSHSRSGSGAHVTRHSLTR